MFILSLWELDGKRKIWFPHGTTKKGCEVVDIDQKLFSPS